MADRATCFTYRLGKRIQRDTVWFSMYAAVLSFIGLLGDFWEAGWARSITEDGAATKRWN